MNEGYGLKRPDKFCAFQASVTTQVLDAPTTEKERVDVSGMKKTKHFILKCVPLHSAYIGKYIYILLCIHPLCQHLIGFTDFCL